MKHFRMMWDQFILLPLAVSSSVSLLPGMNWHQSARSQLHSVLAPFLQQLTPSILSPSPLPQGFNVHRQTGRQTEVEKAFHKLRNGSWHWMSNMEAPGGGYPATWQQVHWPHRFCWSWHWQAWKDRWWYSCLLETDRCYCIPASSVHLWPSRHAEGHLFPALQI